MSSRHVLSRARATAAPVTATAGVVLLVVVLVVLLASVLVAPGAHAEPRSQRPPPPAQQASITVLPPISQMGPVPDRSSGAETVISATFRPARVGRPVVLTRWHHRRWQVVERTTLTRSGRVEFSARSRARGQPVRYRVTALAVPPADEDQHRPRALRRVGRPGLRRRVLRRRPRRALGPPDPVLQPVGRPQLLQGLAPGHDRPGRGAPAQRHGRPRRHHALLHLRRARHPARHLPAPLPHQRTRLHAVLRRLPLRRRRGADEVPAGPRLARRRSGSSRAGSCATARPRGVPRSTWSSGTAPTTAAAA